MKFSIIVSAVFVILLFGFVSIGFSGSSHGKSWEFMESVGGVKIDEPVRDSDGVVYLPVRCDVSGLTAITKAPTSLNSSLVVTGIDTNIENYQIYISVKTGLPQKGSTSSCSGVNLGNVPSGKYQVFYYGSDRKKHLLDKVIVPTK